MSQFNDTIVLFNYLRGETIIMVKLVSQVGTTLNPVQFFKSLHSLVIE